MIEFLTFHEISESTFSNLIIKETLLSFKVINRLGLVRQKLSRLFNYFFQLSKTVALLNFAHRLPLEQLDLLPDLHEELLHEYGRALFHKICVHTNDLIHPVLILGECGIEFIP